MRPRVRRGMPAGTGKSRAKSESSREKKYRLLSADEALIKKALLPENGCSHMYGDVRV